MKPISHKSYLAITVPFIVSTMTQPLLGAVDTAVVGRLDSASYIGGVAIGTLIFNTLYWPFGFLRVGTSGVSAQSLGSRNSDDMCYAYYKPCVLALGIGLLLVLFQVPIIKGAIGIYSPDPDVARHAETYFGILVWGAPFVLINWVSLGWLMGKGRVRESMFLQISANVLNIVLDILFVMFFRMEVAGVAWGTLISQSYGFGLGMVFISKKIRLSKLAQYRSGLLEPKAVKKMVAVNRGLLIRTVCLLAATNMFVAKGSELGASFLAANAVLFQIQYLVAYFFDGLADASSVFAGKSAGENDLDEFDRTVFVTNVHMALVGAAAVIVLLLFHGFIVECFTDHAEIVALCEDYIAWLIAFPFVIGPGLVYFGFFTGAT